MKKEFTVLLLIVFAAITAFAQNEKRLALVIGNAEYVGKGNSLRNPVNDANDISNKLKTLGFDVTTVLNASMLEMDDAIDAFGQKAKNYDVALFYYSGHGLQSKGNNYMVPVDAELRSEADVRYKCVPVNLLLAKLDESKCPMKLIVLDACRNNPFTKSWYRGETSIGLAPVNPTKGTFITFSTAADSVAIDGTGRNSPYTISFLETLDKPNLALFDFFNEVGKLVLKKTNNEQDPWSNHSTINGTFYFHKAINNSIIKTDEHLRSISSFIGDKANAIAEQDSYLARRMLLEVLPKEINNPDRPITSSAELALRTACNYNTAIFKDNKGWISSVALSPDSKYVATSYSNETTIWDIETGMPIKTIEGFVSFHSFSPDSKYLVSAFHNALIVWDFETGNAKKNIKASTCSIKSIAYSPKGEEIAALYEDGMLVIFNALTFKEIKSFQANYEKNCSISFTPNNEQIISSSSDNTIIVWDIETGKKLKTLYAIAFSPDGKNVAEAMDDSILIQDIKTGNTVNVITEGSKNIRSIAFCDGNSIASVYSDKTIKLWDVNTIQCLETTNIGDERLNNNSLSPDGRLLFTHTDFGKLHIWDVKSGEALTTIELHDNSKFHPFNYSVFFSPDCKRIIMIKEETLRIWDITKRESFEIETYPFVCSSTAFSPQGDFIASSSVGFTYLWNARTGSLLKSWPSELPNLFHNLSNPNGTQIITLPCSTEENCVVLKDRITSKTMPLKGHDSYILTWDYSPDGETIVTGSADSTLIIWNTKTGKRIRTLIGHTSGVFYSKYSPDGAMIISISRDNNMKIWDANTGEEIRSFDDQRFNLACFSPNKKIIVSTSDDNIITLWDLATGKLLNSINVDSLASNTILSSIESIAFSPDGKKIVSVFNRTILTVWDVETCRLLYKFKEEKEIVSVFFSENGQEVVLELQDEIYKILNFERGELFEKRKDVANLEEVKAFSPDQKKLVTCIGNRIIIRDVETGFILNNLIGHAGTITSVDFSHDGKQIVSASLDSTIRIWDSKSGQLIRTLEGHTSDVLSVSYSPTEKRIVSASRDKTVKIWDVESGLIIRELERNASALSVAYSPNGKQIVSAFFEGIVKMWDANTGEELLTIKGGAYHVQNASFSSDGNLIIFASDGLIEVYNINEQGIIYCYDTKDFISRLAFSPDGKQIVSWSSKQPIKIFDFQSIQELIDNTQERFKKFPLTPEEQHNYHLD